MAESSNNETTIQFESTTTNVIYTITKHIEYETMETRLSIYFENLHEEPKIADLDGLLP